MPIISNPLTIVQAGENIEDYSGPYTVTENGIVPCSNKRMLSDLTVEVAGGNSAELNITYSDTPPSDTGKLWVKQSAPAAKVIAKQNIAGFVLGTSTEVMSATLFSKMSSTSCAAVGTDIYIFGGYGNKRYNTIQKYDTVTGICSTLEATLSVSMEGTSCAAVGTDIYIFGGNGITEYNTIQKYDTVTGTYSTLEATLSAGMTRTSCAAVGTDIYIFGGEKSGGTNYNIIQKYDTKTGTCITLEATLSADMTRTSCAAVGTDIYIFGGSNSNTYYNTIQKYDTITGIRSTMSATLFSKMSSTSCAAVGTDIYIFGGNYGITEYNTIQKYDTVTGICSTLEATLSVSMEGTSCAAVGTDIYIFGGHGITYYNTIQRLIIRELSLTQNNLLLMSTDNGKEFKLLDSDTAEISFNVNNAYIGNNENKAEFIDAYLNIDGAWVNVNTGEPLPLYTTEANDYGETAIAQAYTTEANDYGQTAILTYGG